MELFGNLPQTNAAGSSGTTVPSPGTIETWTVTTSAGFPAANSAGLSFHFADPALPGEVMQCTNVSGVTWTVVRGAEGTAPAAHSIGAAYRQVVSAGTFGSFIQVANIVAFGADPTGTNASDTAIANAIAACAPGQAAYVPPVTAGGGYKHNNPIVLPPGVGLLGQPSTSTIGQGSGSVLKPSSTFSAGGWPVTSAILIVDQATGGYSSTSEEQHVENIMIDGSNLAGASNVDGVHIYNAGGVNGQALRTSLRNILSYNMTGWGFAVPSIGLNVQAHNLHARACGTATTGSGGFQVHASDSEWTHCSAYSCYGDGWQITDSWDSVFNQIHAEHSTGPTAAGIRYTADVNNATVAVGGVVFDGYSVDGGQWHGIFITSNTNTSLPPITFANGFVRRPGEGGTFAAYCVSGYMGKINLIGPQAYPGQPDGGGSNHAAYGLQMVSNGATTNVSVTGGTLIGTTAAFNIDGSQGLLTVSADTTFGSGINGVGAGELTYTPGVTLQAASSTQLVPVDRTIAMMPAGTLATTLGREQATSGGIAPASGTVYYHLAFFVAGVPVGNLNSYCGTTVKAGGTHGWMLVVNSAGSVMAATADQTDAATTWGTASSTVPLALASTWTPPTTGWYWIVICIVATTMPTLSGAGTLAAGLGTVPPIYCGSGRTGQTTPPAVGTTGWAPTAGSTIFNFLAWAS